MKTLAHISLILVFPIFATAEFPRGSSELLKKLELWEKVELEKVHEKIHAKRLEVIARLEKDLKESTKAGDLDGALSIRGEIERLRTTTPSKTTVVKDNEVEKKPGIPEKLVGKWDWFNGKEFLTINSEGKAEHTNGWEAKISIKEEKITLQRRDKKVEYSLRWQYSCSL